MTVGGVLIGHAADRAFGVPGSPRRTEPARIEMAAPHPARGSQSHRIKHTYLGAKYARRCGRRGPDKASTVVGHFISVDAYHMLRDDVPYNDLGSDGFGRLSPTNARRLARQIEALGFTVTVSSAAA
jgi:hypothetical protein